MRTPAALAGREHASELLRAALVDAGRGHGSLVLVVGDPGIGKTTLVSGIAVERPPTVARRAWGRAVDGLGSPGYWPWTQVLRQLDVLVDGQHLGDGAGDTGGSADDRFRLFERVADALAGVSRDAGLLVVLDDLQWADADSLALLELVGNSLFERPIVVIGIYRDSEAGPGLRRLALGAEVLTLSGLPAAATEQLMRELGGHDVSPDDVARMHRRTGGNPFFIRELTRLDQLRSESGQGSGAVDIVDSVRDVVERRLARLSQPCARMLVTAAIDGPVVRPWVLRAMVDDPADVSALLEEATEARILGQDSDGLRFTHDLFREVIAAGLPPPARSRVHQALATVLESGRGVGRSVHAAELAAQFASAATPEQPAAAEAALRYGRQAAAESVQRLAFDDAAAHLERALTALDATGSAPGPRLELLLEVAAAQQVAGRSAQAAASYHEAFEVAGNVTDPFGQARAALGLHGIGIKTGPVPEREAQAAILESAIAAVGTLDTALRCDLRSALARTLYHSLEAGRMARARAIATENLDAARAEGAGDALIAALRARHDVDWSPGTASDRLALLDELEGLIGPDDLQLRLLRAQALLELGDPRSVVLVDEVSTEAELSGRPAALWLAASRRAASALLAGRMDEARTKIQQAEDIAVRIGDDDARWVADIQRWELARFAGGRDTFARHRPDGEPKVERWPPWRSLVLADAGRADDAAKTLEGFRAAQAQGPGANAGYDLWFPAMAAEAAARSGSDRLRAEMYELLAPYTGTQVGCGAWVAYCGPVDGWLAELAFARGDTATGAAHLQAAQVQCRRLGATLWLDRLRQIANRQTGTAVSTNSLVRSGPVWTLMFDGGDAVVPNTKGLQTIATLLARPHQAVSAAELAGSASPDRGQPVLDRRALADYRSRIQDLADEIDYADADHDIDRAHRARAERESLLDELRRTTGRHGQRRLGDDSERVRKTILARVHRAIGIIAEHHPAMAAHLRDSIDTGSWCAYRPAQPLTWTIRM